MSQNPNQPIAQFDAIRRILISAGIAGTLIFSFLFCMTFARQDTVERVAQDFIRYQIQKEIRNTNSALAQSGYGTQLEGLRDTFGKELEDVQSYLDENLDQKIADAIGRMCRLDCDRKETLRETIRSGLEAQLERAGISLDNVQLFIEQKYESVLGKLRRDLRIFLGTNAVMFGLVMLALLIKRQASVHLLVPSGLLIVSSVISSCLYIFGQNWFFTLIYDDFWGYAYSAYAGLIFLVLLDIFLNQARITTEILNAFFQALGSALSVVSC